MHICFIQKYFFYSRGPQPPGHGPLRDRGLFSTRPHEWLAGTDVCIAQLVQVAGWYACSSIYMSKRLVSLSPQPGHQAVKNNSFLIHLSTKVIYNLRLNNYMQYSKYFKIQNIIFSIMQKTRVIFSIV